VPGTGVAERHDQAHSTVWGNLREAMSTTLLLALLALLTQLQTTHAGSTQRVPVKAHGVMAPTMPLALQRVAYCESRNRHYDQHGRVLRGRGNRHDIGTYQINRILHAQRAKQLGYNLWRPQGNAGYALWLYREQGLAPWDATARCQRQLARHGFMPKIFQRSL